MKFQNILVTQNTINPHCIHIHHDNNDLNHKWKSMNYPVSRIRSQPQTSPFITALEAGSLHNIETSGGWAVTYLSSPSASGLVTCPLVSFQSVIPPPPAERRCLGMTHLSLNDPLLLAWLQQRTHRLNLLWHMRAALGSGYSSLSTMWGMFCATVVVQVAAPWFSCVFCNFDLE